jgi:hypothetical protein
LQYAGLMTHRVVACTIVHPPRIEAGDAQRVGIVLMVRHDPKPVHLEQLQQDRYRFRKWNAIIRARSAESSGRDRG